MATAKAPAGAQSVTASAGARAQSTMGNQGRPTPEPSRTRREKKAPPPLPLDVRVVVVVFQVLRVFILSPDQVYALVRTKWLPMAWRFGLHHLSGHVHASTYRGRQRICAACPKRVLERGHTYCRKWLGGCGGCPVSRWWPFSRLSWLLRLQGFTCPKTPDQFGVEGRRHFAPWTWWLLLFIRADIENPGG